MIKLSLENNKKEDRMTIKKQLKRTRNKVIRKLQKQYSYKNAVRQFDNKYISPYGGYIDIMNFANLLNLDKSIKTHFNVTNTSHRRYTDFNIFQRLLDTVILDIDRIDNADLFYNDPLLRYLEDIDTDPSPATLRRELKACNNNTLSSIENINTEFLHNCSSFQTKQKVTLLIDQTPVPLFGHQEEAKKGYDRHKGEVCYQVMVSSIKETSDVIKVNLEPGTHKHADEYFKEYLKQTMAMIPPHMAINKIRMDSGFFSYPALDLLEKYGIKYFIRGRMNKGTPLVNVPASIPEKDWKKVSKKDNIWVSKKQQYYSPTYEKSYQVIFVRELLKEEDTSQTKLFNDASYHYYPIFSNSPWSPLRIWRFYNDGALVESFIKELKNEFFLDKIPVHEYIANNAFTKIKALAYNIINAFKRFVLSGNWATKSAKAIKNWLIRTPVIVVSYRKGIKLSMAKNTKLQQFVMDIANRVYTIATDFVT